MANRGFGVNEEKQLRIKAATSTLIVFSCMTLPFFFFFLWLYFFRRSDIAPVLITGVLSILVYFWWQSFLLEIDMRSLSYRTLFGGTRQIDLGNIGAVVHKVDFTSRGTRPPIRLEVFARGDKAKPAFDINLKVFSLQDIARIDSVLEPFIQHKR
jgi:hypothetical protein